MALLIWLRNPKHKINILFALAVLSTGLWSMAEAMFREAPTRDLAFLWAKLENTLGSLIIIFFFLFTIYFPYQSKRFNFAAKTLIVVSVVVLYLMIWLKLHVVGVILQEPNNDFILSGWGRTYYTLFMMVYLGIAYYLLLVKYFIVEGIFRKTLFNVLFATGIFASFGSVFGVIFPLIYGRNNPWHAPVFSLPMIVILAWFLLLGDKKISIKPR